MICCYVNLRKLDFKLNEDTYHEYMYDALMKSKILSKEFKNKITLSYTEREIVELYNWYMTFYSGKI